MLKLAAIAGAAVALLVVLTLSTVTTVLGVNPTPAGCTTTGTAADAARHLPLDTEQAANARTIIDTAAELTPPGRAAVIAVATAWQESGLRNLPDGTADSVGLFQQRPSTGWGQTPAGAADQRTPVQRLLDPVYAATAFYTALRAVPGWRTRPLTDAADAVQRSAHPSAYARWEQPATQVVATLTAQACLATIPGAGTAAHTAIDYARAQIGLPYQWGGNGPPTDTGFDCSGLTRAAYAAAGVSLPRTAQAQFDAGPRLSTGTRPQPGDLVFYGARTGHVSHVGLYIGDQHMIDAPHTDAQVRVESYRWRDYLGASRPQLPRVSSSSPLPPTSRAPRGASRR